MRISRVVLAAAGLMAASAAMPAAAQNSFGGSHGIQHVLLISIDGLHAVDFLNCSTGLTGVNGGSPLLPQPGASCYDRDQLSGDFDLQAV
jgi:hypothetical protein